MTGHGTRVFHEADADLGVLAGRTLAVVGYGNQGRSQALNLRDNGLTTIVGNIEDACAEQARADGFEVTSIAEACRRADVVLLLVPDEVMPEVYEREVRPHLAAGDVLDLASGYNVAFGLITPPADVDVVLVAPRMIGPGVRDTFVSGRGFPSFIALHQDVSGEGMGRLLALAAGIGTMRAGCILMSMHDEATLDLFTEQALSPMIARTFLSAIGTLVEAGYPPEAVLLELYLSGELSYTFEKIRELGMFRQMDLHSRTSQYGTLSRSARFADLEVEPRMAAILEEIRDGTFAREWSDAGPAAADTLAELKALRDSLPLGGWEAQTRRDFGIGQGEAPGGS